MGRWCYLRTQSSLPAGRGTTSVAQREARPSATGSVKAREPNKRAPPCRGTGYKTSSSLPSRTKLSMSVVVGMRSSAGVGLRLWL
eukprot:7097472-Prymnesium_polylepis.1